MHFNDTLISRAIMFRMLKLNLCTYLLSKYIQTVLGSYRFTEYNV